MSNIAEITAAMSSPVGKKPCEGFAYLDPWRCGRYGTFLIKSGMPSGQWGMFGKNCFERMFL